MILKFHFVTDQLIAIVNVNVTVVVVIDVFAVVVTIVVVVIVIAIVIADTVVVVIVIIVIIIGVVIIIAVVMVSKNYSCPTCLSWELFPFGENHLEGKMNLTKETGDAFGPFRIDRLIFYYRLKQLKLRLTGRSNKSSNNC